MAKAEAALAGELLDNVDELRKHLRNARDELQKIQGKLGYQTVSEDTRLRGGTYCTNMGTILTNAATSARNMTNLFEEKRARQ